jgi:hypothetical protein
MGDRTTVAVWLVPIMGGVLGGLLYRGLVSGATAEAIQVAEADRGPKCAAYEMRRAG